MKLPSLRSSLASATALALLVAGCGAAVEHSRAGGGGSDAARAGSVTDVFRTETAKGDEIDSVAVWMPPAGVQSPALLFATAKKGDAIRVYDAGNGTPLGSIGRKGSGFSELKRPNGVAVFGDRLYVVERDNHRVQVFALPSRQCVGVFGGDDLIKPYGIAIAPADDAPGQLAVYVTDDYDVDDRMAAGGAEFTHRVKLYHVNAEGRTLQARLVRAFGERSGEGVLHKVESIAIDAARKRLLLCDEIDECLKLYTLGGDFSGEVWGKGIYENDAEGIALVRAEDLPVSATVALGPPGGGGWIIASDQGLAQTKLRVFDLAGKHYGFVVAEPALANTDGLTLVSGAGAPLAGGALYCVHDDRRVQAYRLADVFAALPRAGAAAGTPAPSQNTNNHHTQR